MMFPTYIRAANRADALAMRTVLMGGDAGLVYGSGKLSNGPEKGRKMDFNMVRLASCA
jgi:hypothetical protein